jgi:hypothetical protein
MALIDGELTGAEEARVMAQVAADPALAAYVAEQKQLHARLREEFSDVLSAPLPARLEQAVLRTPMKRQSEKVSSLRALLPRSSGWAPWLAGGAMAAGTVLGLLLAPALDPAPIGSADDRLIARGALARALTTQLASEPNAVGSPTQIGMTFRDRDGHVCRTFLSESGDNDFAGIACRDGEDWRIALLAPATAPAPGSFQPASAAMPPIMRESIEAMIEGMALNADEERNARDSGWR